jgi:hypothetical protein
MSHLKIKGLLLIGDMRSTGKVNLIIKEAKKDAKIVGQLVDCLTDKDPGVRMRAADALEKISADEPICLAPFKLKILKILEFIDQKEVQWHWCQMITRMNLSIKEQRYAISWLQELNLSKSSIVRTFALQALVEFALYKPEFKALPQAAVLAALKKGTPAMRVRANKLINVLKNT